MLELPPEGVPLHPPRSERVRRPPVVPCDQRAASPLVLGNAALLPRCQAPHPPTFLVLEQTRLYRPPPPLLAAAPGSSLSLRSRPPHPASRLWPPPAHSILAVSVEHLGGVPLHLPRSERVRRHPAVPCDQRAASPLVLGNAALLPRCQAPHPPTFLVWERTSLSLLGLPPLGPLLPPASPAEASPDPACSGEGLAPSAAGVHRPPPAPPRALGAPLAAPPRLSLSWLTGLPWRLRSPPCRLPTPQSPP